MRSRDTGAYSNNDAAVRRSAYGFPAACHCYDTQKIIFNECFGRVTIIKTIHYRILECTRIVHVFWNLEFRRKHLKNRIDAIDA